MNPLIQVRGAFYLVLLMTNARKVTPYMWKA